MLDSVVNSDLEYVRSGVDNIRNKTSLAKNYFSCSHVINSVGEMNEIYYKMNEIASLFEITQSMILEHVDLLSTDMLNAAESYDNLDNKLSGNADGLNNIKG